MSNVTINIPPLVNDQGNILVHRLDGLMIPLTFEDNNGVEEDASTYALFFVSGTFRKALSADPTNPKGRRLVLTKLELDEIDHGDFFAVRDETNTSIPVTKWEGRLFKYG